MSLCIICDYCNGLKYGIGTYLIELVNSIKNTLGSIYVITLFSDKENITYEVDDNIHYWYFPKPFQKLDAIDKKELKYKYYRNVLYLIKLHIKSERNILFHLNFIYDNDFPKMIKTFFNCKVLITVHCLKWSLLCYGNLKLFKKAVLTENKDNDRIYGFIKEAFVIEKTFLDSVDKIICLSLFTRNILYKYYSIPNEKLELIYNGINDVKLEQSKLYLRQKYDIQNIPILLFVGRVDSKKGIAYVIRAFRKVLSRHRCHLIIVGEGNFSNYMKECEDIWTHVTWTGKLSKEKLHEIYSIADIGILPSFAEECSYVAIEMMMHALPIIASTSTGLKEMVSDGYNGLHIPIEELLDEVNINIELLAEKIDYMLQHEDIRKLMGCNSRKQYLNKYTSKIMKEKMIELYKNML